MAKKEFKVGETFQCGLIKLKVEKANTDCCLKCFFYKKYLCGRLDLITGSCFSIDRKDGNSIIFVKVEE